MSRHATSGDRGCGVLLFVAGRMADGVAQHPGFFDGRLQKGLVNWGVVNFLNFLPPNFFWSQICFFDY
jgi:hypothetical protein